MVIQNQRYYQKTLAEETEEKRQEKIYLSNSNFNMNEANDDEKDVTLNYLDKQENDELIEESKQAIESLRQVIKILQLFCFGHNM